LLFFCINIKSKLRRCGADSTKLNCRDTVSNFLLSQEAPEVCVRQRDVTILMAWVQMVAYR